MPRNLKNQCHSEVTTKQQLIYIFIFMNATSINQLLMVRTAIKNLPQNAGQTNRYLTLSIKTALNPTWSKREVHPLSMSDHKKAFSVALHNLRWNRLFSWQVPWQVLLSLRFALSRLWVGLGQNQRWPCPVRNWVWFNALCRWPLLLQRNWYRKFVLITGIHNDKDSREFQIPASRAAVRNMVCTCQQTKTT